MNFILEGKITEVFPSQSGTSKAGNEWKKKEFVVETIEQKPKKVLFTLFGDRVDNLADVVVIDKMVSVSFDIESREYNGRYFTNCNAYNVDRISDTIDKSHEEMDKMADAFFSNQPDPSNHTPQPESDLPF